MNEWGRRPNFMRGMGLHFVIISIYVLCNNEFRSPRKSCNTSNPNNRGGISQKQGAPIRQTCWRTLDWLHNINTHYILYSKVCRRCMCVYQIGAWPSRVRVRVFSGALARYRPTNCYFILSGFHRHNLRVDNSPRSPLSSHPSRQASLYPSSLRDWEAIIIVIVDLEICDVARASTTDVRACKTGSGRRHGPKHPTLPVISNASSPGVPVLIFRLLLHVKVINMNRYLAIFFSFWHLS